MTAITDSGTDEPSAKRMPARISLIATVRNERATISSFVDSLLSQNRAPDEIVIVDGASTDGTLECLEDYARKGRIRVISRACNIAQGRNIGIRAATGELIAVTDAGCRVDPDWLRYIELCFESGQSPDVVAGNFRFDMTTSFERAVALATFSPTRETSDTAIYFPSSRSVAFRKMAWEAARGYPEWLYAAEDTLFNVRLRQLGFRFAFARDAVVHWRPRENWSALAKQRFNFARGNSRVGLFTAGYLINLRNHALIGMLFLGGLFYLPVFAGAALAAGWHVRNNLWPQAKRTRDESGNPRNFWKVLLVMEFVRLVNLAGFVAGRWDRFRDLRYAIRQVEWMGVETLDDLPPL
ncbi:MAG: glycosyltransferase [Burkholderiales bacterium]